MIAPAVDPAMTAPDVNLAEALELRRAVRRTLARSLHIRHLDAGSYAGRDGIGEVLPVDVYIPGCPPRPEALIHGLLVAVGRMTSFGDHGAGGSQAG